MGVDRMCKAQRKTGVRIVVWMKRTESWEKNSRRGRFL